MQHTANKMKRMPDNKFVVSRLNRSQGVPSFHTSACTKSLRVCSVLLPQWVTTSVAQADPSQREGEDAASSLLEDPPDLAVLVHHRPFRHVRLVCQVVQQLVLVLELLAQALCQELEPAQTTVQFSEV